MTDLQTLKKKLYSEVWEESLEAADKLAELQTEESLSILIEALNASYFIRNAASLGIREANNQAASKALFEKIKELGFEEEIGTMVYSLETFDCSRYLMDIICLYFEGNYEVRISANTILEEQEFILTPNELQQVTQRLKQEKTTLEELEIKYKVQEVWT